MKHWAELLFGVLSLVSWLAGIVLAKGFWSTIATIFVPPYAWYLVVERGMVTAGWIAG